MYWATCGGRDLRQWKGDCGSDFFFPSVTSRFTQFLWIAPESTEGCLSDLSKKYNPCLQKHIHQCVSALTRRHSVSCPCSEAMFVRPRLCPLAANSSKLAPIFYSVYSSLLFFLFLFRSTISSDSTLFFNHPKKIPPFFFLLFVPLQLTLSRMTPCCEVSANDFKRFLSLFLRIKANILY